MLSKTLRAILEASADQSQATGPSLDLLREVWSTLLGEPLCHRTRPSNWQDGELTVGVASEQWLKEARRNHRTLHARIQRLLPWPVDDLVFVVESFPPAPRSHAPLASSEDAPGAADVDDNVREDLARLDEPTRELMLRIRGHISGEE